MAAPDPDLDRLWNDFHAVVNMASPELTGWLGIAPDDPMEYVILPEVDLAELGRHVLHVLQVRRVDLTDADTDVMRQVIDLASGLLADPPERDAADDRWRHTLMSLGHDPLRADSPRGADAEALRV